MTDRLKVTNSPPQDLLVSFDLVLEKNQRWRGWRGEADSSPAIHPQLLLYSAKTLQLPQALVSHGMQTRPDVLDGV
ncbi:hypothetical protein ROHU_024582 [Labeo rohita]|uniref:Uncharacterized protein n=1 Tax=Labeo rohita TaxID=84645 RepID=A0A498MWG3_LABRO|nr:hypothetical protein ROHU_024582 [Labeo rohita]